MAVNDHCFLCWFVMVLALEGIGIFDVKLCCLPVVFIRMWSTLKLLEATESL